MSAKNIKHYFQNDELYDIYDYYLQLIRSLKGNAFYRRPLESKFGVKFGEQPMGVSKLSGIMKAMCADAGIEGYFTNHSGKRTCATALYQAGVPEQEIMNRTGHRSVESVRKYKRAADDMLKDISNVLEPVPFKKPKQESALRGSENNDPSVNIPACGANSMFSGCVFNFGSNI